MTKILITEFINQNSLENLNKKFDVNYDEKLCEDDKNVALELMGTFFKNEYIFANEIVNKP